MGGGAPPADAPAQFGGVDATEAAAKLVRNRAAVAADIVQHAALSSRLTPKATLDLVEASLALVASRLSGEPGGPQNPSPCPCPCPALALALAPALALALALALTHLSPSRS